MSDKCKNCRGNSWVYRNGKPACLNCLAHDAVKRETICGDHLVPVKECGCLR
jgi:hypothetical protein